MGKRDIIFENQKTREFSPVNNQPSQFLLESYNKLLRQRRVEKWILISSLIIIGYVYVWILAIYWVFSLRNAKEDFYTEWKKNPSFKGIFPYQPAFYDILIENRTYQRKQNNANTLKISVMTILALPFIGYLLILIAFILSFGVIPVLLYYALKRPDKYITDLIKEGRFSEGKEDQPSDLFFYKANGSISYDFSIISQIRRSFSLNESETVLGIFQLGERIWKRPFLVITNQQIVKFTPGYIGDFGEKLMSVRKNQIAGYYIEKGTFLASLLIETTGGWTFTFRNINKNVINAISTAMNQLEDQKAPLVTADRPVQKEEDPIVKPITKIAEPFYCQVCDSSRPATTHRMKCEECHRLVCFDCFTQMGQVGKTACPMCGGRLYTQ